MQVGEAKAMVLGLICRDVERGRHDVLIEAASPVPFDDGKFVIDGKAARVIHHFSGWHVPIHLGWFSGGFDKPRIQRGDFHWYVFAIPRLNRRIGDHYFVCDYLQMRQWVLEFAAPKGYDHRDHRDWLADLRIANEAAGAGYFRWGDEPINYVGSLTRSFPLDNISTLPGLRLLPKFTVGAFGGTGESEAHRLLKVHISRNPQLLELSPHAESEMEHWFRTGDRVDVFFKNHHPERSVVEIEVEGKDNLITGVHQAIKYRALAEAADRYPIQSPRVRAYVVAYETGYDEVREAAAQYQVRLLTVDRRDVLLGSA
jgi:hypothetical protein